MISLKQRRERVLFILHPVLVDLHHSRRGAEQRRPCPRRKAEEKRGALSDHQRRIRLCGVTPRHCGREKSLEAGRVDGGPLVSIRSRRCGREKAAFPAIDHTLPVRVSIRSRRSGREKAREQPGQRRDRHVSIRPRRSGREERVRRAVQSEHEVCFNPPPALRPGGTLSVMVVIAEAPEFRSAPAAQAGRNDGSRRGPDRTPEFQSAPGAQAGRNLTVRSSASSRGLFQSAPGAQAGRNGVSVANVAQVSVSIRPRRSGREELRRDLDPAAVIGELFQSAPGAQAGRNVRAGACRPDPAGFNPPPALRPGGTRTA